MAPHELPFPCSSSSARRCSSSSIAGRWRCRGFPPSALGRTRVVASCRYLLLHRPTRTNPWSSDSGSSPAKDERGGPPPYQWRWALWWHRCVTAGSSRWTVVERVWICCARG
jgi:hypothetical protein